LGTEESELVEGPEALDAVETLGFPVHGKFEDLQTVDGGGTATWFA
jgi:hypothetical protein